MTAGDATVSSLTVSHNGGVSAGSLSINNAYGITSLGALTAGDATVSSLTVSHNGVIVELGGLLVTGGLSVNSLGLTVTGGVTVNTGGLVVTGDVVVKGTVSSRANRCLG